ncbi:MAG: hypothetical protein Q7R52_04995 [archaeon]|nr:hypothetical protein [archaeon]
MSDIKDIFKKYGVKIDEQISSTNLSKINFSQEYLTFKQEMAPELSRYEKWCKSLGNVIKINLSPKDEIKIKKQIYSAHLDIQPWQAVTLSVMAFLSVFFVGILLSVAIMLIQGFNLGNFPVLFFFLMTVVSIFLFYYTINYPRRFANRLRLKASSQMVPAILYVVVYMRHTPNLEKAIAFASENLQYPLALDFKKIFYDVQIGKFSTIKESLDNYLESWRDYSPEFIESFHLIESSLFEPDNSRRIAILEKSLQVVLDGVYDRMLKFSHDVRSPLTNIYMLGVVLPTLGLALLPLASAMLGGMIQWIHVFVLFNLIIPFFVFYLTDNLMITRPGGHGETDLLERNPLYPKYISKKPYLTAALIALPLLIIGLIPLFSFYTGFPSDFLFFGENFFDFQDGNGPFGVGALFLSLFVPLSVAIFFFVAFYLRTKEIIKYRENTKQVETEFNSSLFQLGNRLGNGIPPELVFGDVAESSKGLKTQDFFLRVNYNIKKNGMSVEKALFDPKRGALMFYPSELIATSMKILVESSKKGLSIAALSLMSISEYSKNIQKINERLKDLLAEVISDMKSNMTFLAPLLSGIVIGLAAMITSILNKINIAQLAGQEITGLGGIENLINIFDMTKMIPPYYLQIIIGIYLVQMIFILTTTLVTIDNGEDKLERTSKTGKNLLKGMVTYFVVALIATLSLYLLSTVVLGGVIS